MSITESRTVIVGAASGLHARPAALLASAAAEAAAGGTTAVIAKPGGAPIDAASILSIIALGAAQGDELTVTVTGDRAAEVAERLAELIAAEE